MAYDRYDTRGSSRDRWRSDDSWRDRDRDYGRRDERGFLERAGDEIRSWFGDEDSDRFRRDDMGRDRDFDRDRLQSRASVNRWDRDDDRGRFGRDDDDRGFLSARSYRGTSGESGLRYSSRDRTEPFDRGFGSERGYRPMTGDYGRGDFSRRSGHRDFGRGNFDRDDYRRTSFAGSSERSSDFDPHYSEWRRRQIDEIDRDYDDYRREHQSKFEQDFGSWRERRQSKRQLLGQVREHMEVVGSDGEHVGTVDKTAGDRLILTKSDDDSGGRHHSLPCTMVDRIEEDRVILDCKADEARQKWRDDDRERALFERDDQGEAGPMMLDRSFSGTYR